MNGKFWASLDKWPQFVTAGPFLFFSGQMGRRPDGNRLCTRYEDVPERGPELGERHPWIDRIEGPVAAQAIGSYERIRGVLATEGGDLDCLARLHLYQLDKRFFPVFDRVRRHYEPSAPTPSTAVGMSRFDPARDVRLNVDGIGIRPHGGGTNGSREVLEGSKDHAAAAHFSHVVAAGPYVFIAGQIPLDTSRPGAPLIRNYEDIPTEGRFLQVGRSHEDTRNGPIASQTWFTYDLIRKHLQGAGSSLSEILNLIVYLADIRDFPTFHRVHEHFFPSSPPALTVVEVNEVGHKGTLVEIEATAVRPDKGVHKEVLESGDPLGARMSLGVRAEHLLFLSGMTGTVDDGRSAASDSVAQQTASILDKLRRTLACAEADLERIVHLTVFLKDVADIVQLEPLFKKAFPKQRPAFTVSEVPMPSPAAGAVISVTAIAWLGPEPPAAEMTL